LKSGQTINTKIKEKTAQYLTVEVDNYGTILKYPVEQIESIDGKKFVSEKDSVEVSPGEQNSDWYINTEFNFKIKKSPAG